MIYSNLQLTAMAINQPLELVQILSNPDANINMLVSGAEILGAEVTEEKIVLPILKKLLSHVNMLVREAAIIGIIEFYNNKSISLDIIDKIKYISKFDPSHDLRRYAEDVLKDFEKQNT